MTGIKEGSKPLTRFLDVESFAEQAGLPVSTIRQLLQQGKLTSLVAGRKTMIAARELDRIVDIALGRPVVREKGGARA